MLRARLAKSLCVAGLILLLSGCGYSLRGSDVLSAKFSGLQLDSQQSNSEFTRLLRRSLDTATIEISSNPPDQLNSDLPILIIANEQITARPVTVNPRARAAQIELRLSVDVALTLAEATLIAPETLYVERTYFEDIENISGSQEEIAIISTEMRRELIHQLMRWLAAAEISETL